MPCKGNQYQARKLRASQRDTYTCYIECEGAEGAQKIVLTRVKKTFLKDKCTEVCFELNTEKGKIGNESFLLPFPIPFTGKICN